MKGNIVSGIQNNVTFQGEVKNREKRITNIAAIVGGPLVAAGIAATYGAGGPNAVKADTFVGTIKNNAKEFTRDWKNIVAGLLEFTKQTKWAKQISKLKDNDKRLFAAGFIINTLIFGGAMKLGGEIGSKLTHRND